MNLTRPRLALTPCEEINGRWYKRDDSLAFSNGVNGKVRTSLYLAELAKAAGAQELVYGGSVHAPALGRVASAAAYSGLGCKLVIGSDADKAVRHSTVRVAVEAGAQLVRSKVAYNPALQKMSHDIAAGSDGRTWQVPYGVSTPEDWDADQVRLFLEQDADQVLNLPEQVTTLVMAFGSGNAAAGVLYGLHKHRRELERMVLVGVGPDRMKWLKARMAAVGVTTMPQIEHLPLHPHFAQYNDLMPETEDDIDFHPRYEGKVIRFLNVMQPAWWSDRDGTTCMWVVGS